MGLGPSFTIARIRGIDIRIHWSWVFIFWLITWAVQGVFAEFVDSWSDGERVAAALGASLLFFVSILLHELSHALVAQSYGLRVPSITLFVLGGVAALADEAKNARQELLVALAGPAMSFALAGVYGLAWLALRGQDISVIAGYLSLINFALGLFNLLPGFPLDGGRVFRAIVWARTGSQVRATQIAARAGAVIAYLLIAFGVVQLAFGNFGGLWYVLIGLFLRAAASGSEQTLLTDMALGHVVVREVMRPPPDPVPASTTLQGLVDSRVLITGERCYLVGSPDGTVIGLITTSDITHSPRATWPEVLVEQVMVPRERVQVIGPEEPVLEALARMREHDIHQLPVIDDDRLVGLVTRGDVMRQIELRRRFVAEAPTAPAGQDDADKRSPTATR
jgi:Zn-dependent protease